MDKTQTQAEQDADQLAEQAEIEQEAADKANQPKAASENPEGLPKNPQWNETMPLDEKFQAGAGEAPTQPRAEGRTG